MQQDRGIDLDYFNIDSVTQKRKEMLLRSFSIPENTHIFLLPARLSRWKGHMVAVDAAKYIKIKNPNLSFVFLFVGGINKKSFYQKLKQKIKK